MSRINFVMKTNLSNTCLIKCKIYDIMLVHDVLKYDIMHMHDVVYKAFCTKWECRISPHKNKSHFLTNYNDSENKICLIYVGGCRVNVLSVRYVID